MKNSLLIFALLLGSCAVFQTVASPDVAQEACWDALDAICERQERCTENSYGKCVQTLLEMGAYHECQNILFIDVPAAEQCIKDLQGDSCGWPRSCDYVKTY